MNTRKRSGLHPITDPEQLALIKKEFRIVSEAIEPMMQNLERLQKGRLRVWIESLWSKVCSAAHSIAEAFR